MTVTRQTNDKIKSVCEYTNEIFMLKNNINNINIEEHLISLLSNINKFLLNTNDTESHANSMLLLNQVVGNITDRSDNLHTYYVKHRNVVKIEKQYITQSNNMFVTYLIVRLNYLIEINRLDYASMYIVMLYKTILDYGDVDQMIKNMYKYKGTNDG